MEATPSPAIEHSECEMGKHIWMRKEPSPVQYQEQGKHFVQGCWVYSLLKEGQNRKGCYSSPNKAYYYSVGQCKKSLITCLPLAATEQG